MNKSMGMIENNSGEWSSSGKEGKGVQFRKGINTTFFI